MSKGYLPEGRLLDTPENQLACSSPEGIFAALDTEQILEGRALLCTPEHDLTVAVGPFTGHISREEAALGIREGTTREIAILSRVGKPVAFTVTAFDPSVQPPVLELSRRRAQALTFENLMETPPGTVLPATVTHMEPFGAFVDVGCGFISMIGIENCSVSRISHPSCRFSVGQEILVLLTGGDREEGKVFLSHKELLGTWEENAAQFSPGMTVPGIVRGIQPYGVFVELAPNLTGLAERTEGLLENDRVSVYLRSLLPDRMKIKLNILHRLEPVSHPSPLPYFITEGRVQRWEYSPSVYRGEPILRSYP